MAIENIIKDLTTDPDFYQEWFEHSTDIQSNMIWKHIWDQAALAHSENEFIQGLYDFYQLRGYLTHRQFTHLVRVLFPSMVKTQSLKDRFQ
jgi:hypothetical protein